MKEPCDMTVEELLALPSVTHMPEPQHYQIGEVTGFRTSGGSLWRVGRLGDLWVNSFEQAGAAPNAPCRFTRRRR